MPFLPTSLIPLDIGGQVEHTLDGRSSYTWSDRCSSSSLSYRYRGNPVNVIRAFTRWVSKPPELRYMRTIEAKVGRMSGGELEVEITG